MMYVPTIWIAAARITVHQLIADQLGADVGRSRETQRRLTDDDNS